MIVVCDTNILSSFAAGDAFPLLLRLFARAQLGVPPSVRQELQTGLARGNSYLSTVLQAIDAGHIEEFALSSAEVNSFQDIRRSLISVSAKRWRWPKHGRRSS